MIFPFLSFNKFSNHWLAFVFLEAYSPQKLFWQLNNIVPSKEERVSFHGSGDVQGPEPAALAGEPGGAPAARDSPK